VENTAPDEIDTSRLLVDMRGWSWWRRFRYCYAIFWTGIVPEFTAQTVDKLIELYDRLGDTKAREVVAAEIRGYSSKRRQSMFENANRGSFVLSAIGISIGVAGVALAFGIRGRLLAVSLTPVLPMLLSAAILALAIIPKSDVFEPADLVLTAVERAEEVIKDQEDDTPGLGKFLRDSRLGHVRKMQVLVDRRALRLAGLIFVNGLAMIFLLTTGLIIVLL